MCSINKSEESKKIQDYCVHCGAKDNLIVCDCGLLYCSSLNDEDQTECDYYNCPQFKARHIYENMILFFDNQEKYNEQLKYYDSKGVYNGNYIESLFELSILKIEFMKKTLELLAEKLSKDPDPDFLENLKNDFYKKSIPW